MRYSIMLQVVSFITLILLGNGALFAWLQTRPGTGSQATTSQVQTETDPERRDR
jgi:hypothetical protein